MKIKKDYNNSIVENKGKLICWLFPVLLIQSILGKVQEKEIFPLIYANEGSVTNLEINVSKDAFDKLDLCNYSFYVYKDYKSGCNHFVPSGWMGDDSSITFKDNWKSDVHSGKSCIKIKFKAGNDNWAGIYWQNPENNWCDIKNGGYDISGAVKVTFQAKGENGGENIEFFVGGIGRDNSTGEPKECYPDSMTKTSTGYITLTGTWTEHTIDLTSEDLSYVIGGFGWVTSSSRNPNSTSTTFYLDEIKYDKLRDSKIFGSVIDTNGESIKNAKLTLKGKKTKIKRKIKSEDDGTFEFTSLPADTYVVKAQKKNYKKSNQELVELGDAEETKISITLENEQST